MQKKQVSITQGINLIFLYCLPALLVLALLLGSYYFRATEVATYIDGQRQVVEKVYNTYSEPDSSLSASMTLNTAFNQDEQLSEILNPKEEALSNERTLIKYFINYYVDHSNKGLDIDLGLTQISNVVYKVWLGNSFLISVMVLVPFLLLSGGIGFSRTLNIDYSQRLNLIHSGWWIKCVVALIVAYGWIYLINPQGRGSSTISQYLIAVDLAQADTLPLFLRDFTITPVIAGFLGWYLYMLTYFFSKMTSDDVTSTAAYGTLLQKFLFTWGVTIVFIAVSVEEYANVSAFMIGYFPMAAFSLIKDKGLNVFQGTQQEKGRLAELPGISRWQILRLEEEGINSLGALAYRQRQSIDQYLPGMSKLVDFWTDIARLYTIVGEDNYEKIRNHCKTASEFIIRAEEADFIEALAAMGINNTAEYARILPETFPALSNSSTTD